MSKFVNVTVSTSLSTDFYLEVPDDATEDQIKEYGFAFEGKTVLIVD